MAPTCMSSSNQQVPWPARVGIEIQADGSKKTPAQRKPGELNRLISPSF